MLPAGAHLHGDVNGRRIGSRFAIAASVVEMEDLRPPEKSKIEPTRNRPNGHLSRAEMTHPAWHPKAWISRSPKSPIDSAFVDRIPSSGSFEGGSNWG